MQRIVDYSLVIINPVRMDTKEKYYLSKILHANSALPFFSTRCAYSVTGNLFLDNTNLYLTDAILRRPCNPQGKHAGQYRYEVIDTKLLGKGGYGEVAKSLGTLHVMANNALFFKTPLEYKQRVIKKFIPEPTESLTEIMALADYQYQLMRRMDHLHAKPPVNTGESVYLVMRKMPGITLYDFMKKERIGALKLTLSQRFKLAFNIAIALQQQVHDKHMMHRDLNSKNIMVEQKNDDFNINIIDLDWASDIDDVREIGYFPVTHHSVAPELRGGYAPSSINSDIYSLARLISEIFKFNVEGFRYVFRTCHEQLRYEEDNDIYLDGIFENIADVNKKTVKKVHGLLTKMGKYQPSDRCSLTKATSELKLLYQEAKESEEIHFTIASDM